jgi:hypothetical protein
MLRWGCGWRLFRWRCTRLGFREGLCCLPRLGSGGFVCVDDEEYLGLGRSVRDIEQEARQLGMLNKSRGVRPVV